MVYTQKFKKIFILLLSVMLTLSYTIVPTASANTGSGTEGDGSNPTVKQPILNGATVKISDITIEDQNNWSYRGTLTSERKNVNLKFTKTLLKEDLPHNPKDLVGRTITVIYEDVSLVEDQRTRDWKVYDWNFETSTPTDGYVYFEDVVVLKQMRFSEDHVHQYDVETTTNQKYKINRVNFFDTRANPKHLYDNNYAGSTVKVYGAMSTTDDKTMDVRNWVMLSPNTKVTENQDRETEQLYGKVIELSYEERDIVYALFRADDGQHYMTAWDDEVLLRLKNPPTDVKMIIDVEYINKNGKVPSVNVLSFSVKEDAFEYKTNDVLSITGIPTELITKEAAKLDGTTTVTYKFNSKGIDYYAVFDSTVLGNYNDLWLLEGKKIEITGVVYKEGRNTFIGVASYRNPFADQNYGKDYNGSDLNEIGSENVTALTITNVTMVSYDSKGIVYKGITSEGLEHYFVYSKALLGANYTEKNLVGSTFRVTVVQSTQSKANNMYYVRSMEKVENILQDHRGTVTELLVKGSSTATYTFETITGQKMKVIFNNASIELVGDAEDLVGISGTIYGKFANVTGENLFDVYELSIAKAEKFSERHDDTVTFRGYIKEFLGTTGEGLLFYATNQYGQEEYLYFETDYMKDYLDLGLSIEVLMAGEVTITGIRTSEYIMVKSFGKPEIPDWYPTGLESKLKEREYFPNLKGWTGFLEVSDIYGQESQLVLVTSNDRYFLNGSKEVMALVEANLGNIVYLRGEYREAGYPYWTGEIKVYDLQFKQKGPKDNVIYKPAGEEVPDLMPDPQKPAIHTLQLHDKPADFEYGDAILEALYFPELIKVEVPVNGKK